MAIDQKKRRISTSRYCANLIGNSSAEVTVCDGYILDVSHFIGNALVILAHAIKVRPSVR